MDQKKIESLTEKIKALAKEEGIECVVIFTDPKSNEVKSTKTFHDFINMLPIGQFNLKMSEYMIDSYGDLKLTMGNDPNIIQFRIDIYGNWNNLNKQITMLINAEGGNPRKIKHVAILQFDDTGPSPFDFNKISNITDDTLLEDVANMEKATKSLKDFIHDLINYMSRS